MIPAGSVELPGTDPVIGFEDYDPDYCTGRLPAGTIISSPPIILS